MKLHEKLKAQASQIAAQSGLPQSEVPRLVHAMLMGATVALDHLAPKEEPEKLELALCADEDL